MIKSAPFSTRRSPTKSTFHLSPPTHSDAYEDHDFSEEDEDFEFDSDITEFFSLFSFSHMQRRNQTAERSIRQCTSLSLSRRSLNRHCFQQGYFPVSPVSPFLTFSKCYQILGTDNSPRLFFVGNTSSPFPCEYIKIPAYLIFRGYLQIHPAHVDTQRCGLRAVVPPAMHFNRGSAFIRFFDAPTDI